MSLKEKLLDKAIPVVRKVSVYKPEIFVGLGIVCVAAGVVLSCKATLEVDDIIDEHKEKMDLIHDGVGKMKTDGTVYSKENQKMDTVKQYGKTIARLGRVYAPGIGFTVLGVGFFLGAYKVLKTRNIALLGVCQALQTKLRDYDARLTRDYGEDVAYAYRNGLEIEEVKEAYMEDGKKKTKKVEAFVPGDYERSPYARFFDPASKYWKPYSDINLLFLKMCQEEANRMLNSRGSVMLNEVYDMLDVPRTTEAAQVGWLSKEKGGIDGFVDFGIFNGDDEATRRFVNGYEDVILLDFNVDGVVYDKL